MDDSLKFSNCVVSSDNPNIFANTPQPIFCFCLQLFRTVAQSGLEEMAALKKELVTPDNWSDRDGTTRSILSKLRIRHPDHEVAHTHRLGHLKTDSEHLVQFDGSNDPYKPLNWSFTKKSVTTVLYGFITMGKFSSVL